MKQSLDDHKRSGIKWSFDDHNIKVLLAFLLQQKSPQHPIIPTHHYLVSHTNTYLCGDNASLTLDL
jgi:hypothetical protein